MKDDRHSTLTLRRKLIIFRRWHKVAEDDGEARLAGVLFDRILSVKRVLRKRKRL